MTTDAPRAGTEPDPGTEPDEGYLERLLLLHPECDPEPFEEAPQGRSRGGQGGEPVDPRPDRADAPRSSSASAAPPAPRSPTTATGGSPWCPTSHCPNRPAPWPRPRPATAAARLRAVPDLPFHTVTAADAARPRWRRNIPYVAVVLIISVVIAAMALAPGGERPVLLSGVPSTDAGGGGDPLAETWRLDKLNLQFSQVEKGYVQVFDGAIDPVGTDGCTQPTKEDGVVATSPRRVRLPARPPRRLRRRSRRHDDHRVR